MRTTVLFQLGTTIRPRTLARLLDLHLNTAVDWVNRAGDIYPDCWGHVLRDEDTEDLDPVDPGRETLDEDGDGAPEGLLDELGLL
ncbi:hypothetical protein ACWDOR_10855 [Streptosporangium canum]